MKTLTQEKPRNTVIVGQGAIGLLCYHYLSQLAPKTTTLLPSNRLKLTEQKFNYQFSTLNTKTTQHTLAIASQKHLKQAQLILICVKSYQVKNAFDQIASYLADDAIIILSHNGLGTVEQITHQIKPNQKLLALLLTHGAKKTDDKHVIHTGKGGGNLGLLCGTLPKHMKNQCTKQLTNALGDIHWQENIKQAQWQKLAINAVINPMTALNNIDNGDIRLDKFSLNIKQVLQEVVAVAAKEKVILDIQILESLVLNVAKKTAQNTSSMRADILAKRKTEIDYINGYIKQLGEKHNLATVHNGALWQAIKNLEENF
jgi:2-dehydropantoate 2-reductase